MLNQLLLKIRFIIHKKSNPILWTQTSEEFLHVLIQYLKKSDKVIELGCGSAHISFILAKLGYNIALNEIRENSLIQAKDVFEKHSVSVKYISGNLFSISDHYDFAWNSGLIQCFTDSEKKRFVAKLAKNFNKILLFFPNTLDQNKVRGSNKKNIPGVDDAIEYDISNIPKIIQSKLTIIHFGTIRSEKIGLPYNMYWIYGDNS